MGAVFACIIAKTFLGLRDSDRFYYENSGAVYTFSQVQREELAKVSLSRVICDNTDISKVPRNAFLANQERELCAKIESMNLSWWNEAQLPEQLAEQREKLDGDEVEQTLAHERNLFSTKLLSLMDETIKELEMVKALEELEMVKELKELE